MTLATDRPLERSPRRALGGLLLYFGLFAPVLAWALQEYVCFGLASHACFPQGAPRASFLPPYEGVWGALLSLNVALLIVCLVGVVTSLIAIRSARTSGGRSAYAHETSRASVAARRRTFASAGALVSLLFLVAIAANTVSLMTLSTCSQA